MYRQATVGILNTGSVAGNWIWKNKRKCEQELDVFNVGLGLIEYLCTPFQSSTQRRFALGSQEYELHRQVEKVWTNQIAQEEKQTSSDLLEEYLWKRSSLQWEKFFE